MGAFEQSFLKLLEQPVKLKIFLVLVKVVKLNVTKMK